MKLFFMSDIHGSLTGLNQGLDAFEREGAEVLVLLGDLMYHGPRNPLPDEYRPKEVADRLNAYKSRILAVRGNCDSEVDQMLIEFPMMAEYAMLFADGRRIFATHGHHHHLEDLPALTAGDVFIQGHTHVPVAEKRGEVYVLNPGSVSLPKENHPPSYGLIADRRFQVKSFSGECIKEISW
ncbi:phosphodiesterase [Gorillibacterium sp. CAU 1737]|uniref:phosphodiesterase n=1 Tax=Gorillibacterium sp. CAU 1737 TaxID=3140362 RepID=UPI003260CCB9